MHSTYNEGTSVVAERFIMTLKCKIYKKVTANDGKSYLGYLNNIILLIKIQLMLIILLCQIWQILCQKLGGKIKHELQVTSSNPRVTNSNPPFLSSNLRVTNSSLRVRALKARVARLKARVWRLKARVEAIKLGVR